MQGFGCLHVCRSIGHPPSPEICLIQTLIRIFSPVILQFLRDNFFSRGDIIKQTYININTHFWGGNAFGDNPLSYSQKNVEKSLHNY